MSTDPEPFAEPSDTPGEWDDATTEPAVESDEPTAPRPFEAGQVVNADGRCLDCACPRPCLCWGKRFAVADGEQYAALALSGLPAFASIDPNGDRPVYRRQPVNTQPFIASTATEPHDGSDRMTGQQVVTYDSGAGSSPRVTTVAKYGYTAATYLEPGFPSYTNYQYLFLAECGTTLVRLETPYSPDPTPPLGLYLAELAATVPATPVGFRVVGAYYQTDETSTYNAGPLYPAMNGVSRFVAFVWQVPATVAGGLSYLGPATGVWKRRVTTYSYDGGGGFGNSTSETTVDDGTFTATLTLLCHSSAGGAAISAPPPPGTPTLDPHEYVTTARLAGDAQSLANKLPPDIDLVVGVARSGLVPAGIVATAMHVPLRTVADGAGVTDPGRGFRLSDRPPAEPRHVLVVDDTAASGRQMQRVAPLVRAAFPGAKVSTAVVYCHPAAAGSIDHFAAIYPGLHYLEWNWPNAGHGQGTGFDFDGILCRECRPEEDDDGPAYLNFLRTAEPLFLPRRRPVHTVVTARHRRYEAETRDWLARHGVSVTHLVMRDWEWTSDAPHDPDRIARWKAEHYARSGLPLFAESEPRQAEVIARESGKPVLCPAAGRVFPGRAPARDKAAEAAAEAAAVADAMPCPHRLALLQTATACCDAGGSVWKCGHPDVTNKRADGGVTLTPQPGVTLDDCSGCEFRPSAGGTS